MAGRAHSHSWLLSIAVLTLAVSGCASTSQTNVSTPNTGWMASLKKRLSPQPEYPVTVVQVAPNREPSSKLFVAYGRLEESRNNLTKAHEAYNTALSKNPESYNAILGLARIEQLAGRPESAEQGFLKARKIAPDSPDVLSNIGQFYASQQRWDEAIASHRQAFQLAPVNKSYRYELARVLTQAGRIDEGLSHFEKTGIGIAAAHYNVGVILHEQGRLAASEQHLLHATIHAPEMHQAQEWLDVVRRDKSRQKAIANSGSTSGPIRQASATRPPPRPAAVKRPAAAAPRNLPGPAARMKTQMPAQNVQHYRQAPTATVLGIQPIPTTAPTQQ